MMKIIFINILVEVRAFEFPLCKFPEEFSLLLKTAPFL